MSRLCTDNRIGFGVLALPERLTEGEMRMARLIGLMSVLAGIAVLFQGCYEEQHVVMMRGELVPMTQQDVVQMVRDGAPNSEIIREVRESGTVFRLSASDVENLKGNGVPEEVVNFMLSTREAPPRVVRRRVVVERPPVVVYDPWWTWDYVYAPGYYYYPYHVGLSFSYTHFGRWGHHRGYGVHFGHWR